MPDRENPSGRSGRARQSGRGQSGQSRRGQGSSESGQGSVVRRTQGRGGRDNPDQPRDEQGQFTEKEGPDFVAEDEEEDKIE